MNVLKKKDKIHDEIYYQCCKDLIKAVLGIFKSEGKPASSRGSLSTEYIMVGTSSFPLFSDKRDKKIKALPEFFACIEVMKKNNTINKHLGVLVGTFESARLYTAEEYLELFIRGYLLEEKDSFELDNDVFDKAYCELEYFFYSDTIKLEFLSFLEHFSFEGTKTKLSDNICIIKLSPGELERFNNVVSNFALTNCKYAIRIHYEAKKTIGRTVWDEKEELPSQVAKSIASRVVSALRIFKSGIFGFNYIRTNISSWNYYSGQTYNSSIYIKHFFRGEQYTLKTEDIEDFVLFWNLFNKKHNKEAFLDVALRRFGYSYERERSEDYLIDNMIAFESLFLNDNNKEASYRLSIRASFFIGENPIMQKQVFQDMRLAYKLRSSFVHGASQAKRNELLKTHKTTLLDFTTKVDGYLRHSLKKFIQMSATLEQKTILDDLDNQIFSKEDSAASAAGGA